MKTLTILAGDPLTGTSGGSNFNTKVALEMAEESLLLFVER